MALKLTSPAFGDGQPIPRRHTCDGDDVSPPLSWEDPPEGTRSFALIVEDPDAPDPERPETVFAHWVVYGVPPEAGGLEEGASSGGLPGAAVEGQNDFGRVGWGGPCPPVGRHRYFHRLYALDMELAGLGKPSRQELLAAIEGHVLDETALMGTYEKGG